MEAVLADELPAKPTPAVLAGLARPGIVALGTYWNKREDLVAALPEFQNSDERPVEQRDLREGLIGSKLLSGCVAAGLSSAELGMLKVNHNLCGGETWSVEYRVRRPLFVFTLIDNVGTNALAIANVFGMKEEPQGLAPRPVRIPASGRDGLDVSAIVLQPGYSMAIPTAVLLSPPADDDLSVEWLETPTLGDRVAYTAYSNEHGRLGHEAYLLAGPSFTVSSVQVSTENDSASFEAPLFDLRRVYLLGMALMAGSCPHAVVELDNGQLVYLGEILADAWKQPKAEDLVMPADAKVLHLCEFEFETTTLHSVRVGKTTVVAAATILRRGEALTIAVRSGDIVQVIGQYDCSIGQPTTDEQHRLKRSLVAGGLRALATTDYLPSTTPSSAASPLAS